MQDEFVRNYFDSVASTYLRNWTDLTLGYPLVKVRSQYVMRWFAQHLPNHNTSILDLGCGPGYLLEQLASLGYQVHGLDLSPGMVKEARERLESRGFGSDTAIIEVGDVTRWEPSRQFGGVAALGVLEYLSNDKDIMSIANKSLTFGGLFIVECRNCLFNLVSLNRFTKEVVQSGEYEDLLREYEELQCSSLLCGFEERVGELAKVLNKIFNSEKFVEGPGQVNAELEKEQGLSFTRLIRRQHTPLKLAKIAGLCGFEMVYLRFLHFHPFSPIFEKQSPELFRKLGMAFEVLGETPVGAAMSSSFLAGFEKRSEAT